MSRPSANPMHMAYLTAWATGLAPAGHLADLTCIRRTFCKQGRHSVSPNLVLVFCATIGVDCASGHVALGHLEPL